MKVSTIFFSFWQSFLINQLSHTCIFWNQIQVLLHILITKDNHLKISLIFQLIEQLYQVFSRHIFLIDWSNLCKIISILRLFKEFLWCFFLLVFSFWFSWVIFKRFIFIMFITMVMVVLFLMLFEVAARV